MASPIVFVYAYWREAPSALPLGELSLSKNFQIAPVSAIIEETGVFSWKIGEKTHGMSQSL